MSRVGVSAAAVVCLCLSSLSALAQQPTASAADVPKNPNIEVAYDPPKSQQYQAIYQRIRDLGVFEMLQQFLSPLKLPKKITVKSQECGAQRIPYKAGAPAVICYEYIAMMEQAAPAASSVAIDDNKITKEGVIVGAFVNEVLSEVALAVFDALQIPVWGNANDAADNVAALLMTQFGDEVAWRTLIGTSWFLAQRSYIGRGTFTEVMASAEAPRFYNYLCIAYASNPDQFKFLSNDIPSDRMDWCQTDYRKLTRSFRQTIMPYVDLAALKKVQSIDWTKRLQMTKAN